MPAIITHHLFGEDAARKLPAGISFDGEGLLAFLLGNQGPDPYYFCFTATPMAIATCHHLAETMHREHVVELLVAMRDTVTFLRPEDRGIGQAFALGVLAHYLLDSEAHAFIQAQEDAICDAGVGLEEAHDEVHVLIESELDTWMLWNARSQTVLDAPAEANLARTDRIGRVAGALFSQAAWQVFEIKVGADQYERCVRDYELIYRTIDPLGNPRGKMLAGAERLGMRSSRLEALAHDVSKSDTCPAANLECHPWTDPLTGSEQTTSFPDVFYDALALWPNLAEAYLHKDLSAFASLVRRGYDGNALDDAPTD